MDHGKKGTRSRQKILYSSRIYEKRSNTGLGKYIGVEHFLTNFETTFFRVTGERIHIRYSKGVYYIGTIHYTHRELESALAMLLAREWIKNTREDSNE